MFSKFTTQLYKQRVTPYQDESVYWVQLIPSAVKDKPHGECSYDGRNCIMRMIENTTVFVDESSCPQISDNVHERIKQKVLIPLTILILVTNLIVLLFIIINKRFHTPTYMFIASLGVADLFVGFVSIVTIATKANEQSQNMCLARIGVTVTAISASVWSLTCVAVDRYFAVKRALLYRSIMTKRKILIGVTWSWTISIVIGFLPLIGWKDSPDTYGCYCSFMYVLPKYYIIFIFSVSAIVPFTAMFIIYVILFKSARFHIKQIQIIEKLQTDRKNSGVFGISKRNIRSVKTFAAVLGCVILTWSPLLLTTLVQLFLPNKNCSLQEIIGTHLLVLGFSNSFFNPLIYAVGTKDFRSKVREVCWRRCYVLNSSQVFPTPREETRPST